MRNSFLLLMTLVLAGALIALSAQATETRGDVRARELIGMAVAGAGGEPMGELVSLLLNVRDSGPHYALLAPRRSSAGRSRTASATGWAVWRRSW